MTYGKTHILILGGGFGGLYAALYLDKTFVSDPNVEVTLVSRENYALFTPMLHGLAERAITMKNGTDPFLLRNRVIGLLESASLEESEGVRRAMLTFVVAGGSF